MIRTLPILGGLLVAGLLALSPVLHFTTMEEVSFTVDRSERVTTGVGGDVESKYLIFTESETFENTDSMWALKFNSSDIYGKMQEGSKCLATVTGVRVPFLSMYRNVLDVDCVGEAS